MLASRLVGTISHHIIVGETHVDVSTRYQQRIHLLERHIAKPFGIDRRHYFEVGMMLKCADKSFMALLSRRRIGKTFQLDNLQIAGT